MEEVISLARRLEASLIHVKRSYNLAADEIAKVSVHWSSLTFSDLFLFHLDLGCFFVLLFGTYSVPQYLSYFLAISESYQ